MKSQELKGVVLAGGYGTRLHPLTKITNKHLLPVYDRPMIYYPIQALVNAGIRDIMVVTGGNNAGDFLRLLENGREFGLPHLHYGYQEGAGGIAEALGLAEHFCGGHSLVVILGDQIIEKNIIGPVNRYRKQAKGAKVILKQVDHPEHYGVPTLEGDSIVKITEKPDKPESPYAVIGVYMYDSRVFDIVRTLKPSNRGELEITDVNNQYIEWGEMTYDVLDGWWGDPGVSVDALFLTGARVRDTGANKVE